MKKYIFQDGGESANTVIVEQGEVVKDIEGNIFQISSLAPSHDDKELVLTDSIKKVKPREAGVLLEGVAKVLSASQEQINSGKRKDKIRDDIVALSKEELLATAIDFNLELKEKGLKKEISPSKSFNLIKENKDIILAKIDKKVNISATDKYGKNANKANLSYANSLPTDDELFEKLFEIQESSKEKSGVDFNSKEQGQLGLAAISDATATASATKKSFDLDGLVDGLLSFIPKDNGVPFNSNYQLPNLKRPLPQNSLIQKERLLGQNNLSLQAINNSEVNNVSDYKLKKILNKYGDNGFNQWVNEGRPQLRLGGKLEKYFKIPSS